MLGLTRCNDTVTPSAIKFSNHVTVTIGFFARILSCLPKGHLEQTPIPFFAIITCFSCSAGEKGNISASKTFEALQYGHYFYFNSIKARERNACM